MPYSRGLCADALRAALDRLQFGLRRPLPAAAPGAASEAPPAKVKEPLEALRVTCTDPALEAESVADADACSPRQVRQGL